MMDCISREATINYFNNFRKKISSMPLMDVVDRLKELPSVTPLSSGLEKNSQKLEKDFGELDCISRAQTQTEIEMSASRYTIAKERGGMGQVEWSDQLIKVSDAVDIIRNLPSVTPQEPFINKPCVSSGACEHDKNKVLETIRAELHATAEMHEDGDYYLRDEWIDEYFDKYKAEFEPQESERDA